MAATETVSFEMESDEFVLKRSKTGVEFLVNGHSYSKDLPSAKINRETRDCIFMGRNAGKLDASCDLEAIASKLDSWYSSGQVHHVDDEADFDQRKANGIAVGKFSAEWCGPCKMVAPKIAALSLKYPDVTFLHVDGDKQKGLMRREGASCYPTFFFYVDGVKQATKIEGADAAKVEQTIKDLGAVEQETAATDVEFEEEQVTILCERDQFVLTKESEGVSVKINGQLVMPAGKCPGIEVDKETRKLTIGRGGGVVYESTKYNVQEVLDTIASWFPTAVVHVHSIEEFDKITRENDFVVAKYSASWCGPCIAIAPQYNKLSLENGNIVFLHIDVDKSQALKTREGITAMPTFHFYSGGNKVEESMVRGADINAVKASMANLVSN